jgi:CRP-like cAMP-binding protein
LTWFSHFACNFASLNKQEAAVTLALADNELLKGFEPAWVSWFEERCIQVAFSQGEFMIEKGHSAIGLYLILDGVVSVRTESGGEFDRSGAGAVIGEMSLLDGGKRSVDVVAITDVSSLLLTASQFEAMKVERPEIALAVMTNLCRILSSRIRGMVRLLS